MGIAQIYLDPPPPCYRRDPYNGDVFFLVVSAIFKMGRVFAAFLFFQLWKLPCYNSKRE